jgi:hypothetical protein
MLVEVMYVSNERKGHGKEEIKIKCTHTALHYSHLALVLKLSTKYRSLFLSTAWCPE